MIEQDDEDALNNPIKGGRQKFCIRFNVADVRATCMILDEHKVEYKYYEFDWGQLSKFKDPDGNLVGIRSAKEHEEDIGKN